MNTTPQLLDVVALLTNVSALGLLRGQVGTVVELLDGACEVEFSDDEGTTYVELALESDQPLILHHRPHRPTTRARRHEDWNVGLAFGFCSRRSHKVNPWRQDSGVTCAADKLAVSALDPTPPGSLEPGSPQSPVESNEYGVQDFHAAARKGIRLEGRRCRTKREAAARQASG
jgi:hypothetical protein